jgi:putative ABC transport system ATP-binding protein
LENRLSYYSNQISGGQKQRVAIARALVNNPEIIFADEPTGNLDSKSGTQVMDILADLNKQGKTIILVTHDRELVKYARRIIEMMDGRVVSG